MATAAEARQASEPTEPLRMVFRWRIAEEGARYQGRGVARLEPPYRLRLDLFLPNGETLFQAALLEEEVRIPVWAPRELAPPPALLWAALGVFRPGRGVEPLLGGRTKEGEIVLRYPGRDQDELRFWLRGERVVRAELVRRNRLEEDLRVTPGKGGAPLQEAVYRNLREFRELRIHLESVERVESFPPDIWYPGG